ncbi:protein ACCELERATED CELL DEATH 6 [Aegilops tauschii subsp. strangulata]|uniref:protein ACCELERATED CELL DEATH 6 n=1 Tax=Aegilops tauschii subsp. strangulata TaxID=200361 RepID=UPI001E1CAD7F|nr:ankyrin repeat-containing protein NPR4 [Aegilops tauschii subsp. strangulata]
MAEELLKAATCGELDTLKMLISTFSGPGTTPVVSDLRGTTPAGNTCLHISCIHGHIEFFRLALEVDQSLLSKVNDEGETPLVIAVAHGHANLASLLLTRYHALGLQTTILRQDKDKSNALHHAIRNGYMDLAIQLLEAEPALSHHVNIYYESPMFMAVMRGFGDIALRLLEINDSSHAGSFCRHALHAAAKNGDQVIAAQIMKKRPQLAREADSNEDTPIRLAVCYNKVGVLRELLQHDISLGYEVNNQGITSHEKNLDWKEVQVLMLKADPKDDDIPSDNLHKEVEQQETIESIKERKSTTQRYTTNTSLVAILLATITFTAAFTLPGGYSSDPGSEGIPIMSKKAAFQAFLIFDTLAMCSAFVVAVICLMGRWEDDRFTSYYITVTKRLTWVRQPSSSVFRDMV